MMSRRNPTQSALPAPSPVRRRGRGQRRSAAGPGRATGAPGGAELASFRLSHLGWTPVLVGFLVYIFAIITYRLPVGNVGMILGLTFLPFQKQRFRLPFFVAVFGAFLLWAVFGYTQTQHPEVVHQELITMGKVWLVALVAVNALRTRRHIQLYLILSVALFAMYPARGAIFNYVFYRETVMGRAVWNYIYSNPNDLAALTLLQIGVAVALLVTETNRLIRAGALASVVVLPTVVLMTQSRGALIALAVFAVLSLPVQRNKLRNTLLIGVLGVIVVVLAPGGVWQRARGLIYLRDTSHLERVDREGSAEQRFDIWKVAAHIIEDHPVSGVGLGAYPYEHQQYAASTAVPVLARGTRDTHSTLLNVTAETGIVGAALFLLILAAVILRAERARRWLRRSGSRDALALWFLEAGLIAYLTAGLFGSFAKLSHLYIYLALLTAFSMATERRAVGPRLRAGARRTPVPADPWVAALPAAADGAGPVG